MRSALLIPCLVFLVSAASATEPASSFQGLGDLPGGSFESVALGVSPDGRVVTGWSRSEGGDVPFRWENGAMVAVEASVPESRRESADGRFRVGSADTTWGHEATLWRDGQPLGLGGLSFEHEFFSRALGVSADGGVVVGASDVEGRGSAAFLWSEAHGIRALADVLVEDHGLDLTGWTLAEATAISDDGRTVVGFGQNRDGHTEAWRARLGEPLAAAPAPPHVFGRYERTLRGFHEPAGAAITPDGRLYVADRGLHQVVEHAPDGRVVRVLSQGPDVSGPLRQPSAVAVLADGTVVVLDSGNHRVVSFDREGNPLRAWGRFGQGRGEFHRPLGLAISGAWIAVADSGNGRVQLFNRDSTQWLELVGPDGPWRPTALAFDTQGRLVVADPDSGRVSSFDPQGRPLPSLSLPEPPSALAWQGPTLLALSSESSRVEAFDAAGARLGSWGRPARWPREGEGRLHRPESLVLSPAGERALLCEPGEGRCQLFRRGPEPPAHRPAHPPAYFGELMSVAGRLLAVATPSLGGVDLFDLEAPGEPRLLTRIGELGSGFGQLREVSGLVLDLERGRLWVSDRGNRRVSEFELPSEIASPESLPAGAWPRARFLRAFDTFSQGMRPGALAVTAKGSLMVVDETQATLRRFDTARRFDSSSWKTLVSADEVGSMPLDVAVDEAAAELVMLTAFPFRVHRFDLEGRPRAAFEVPPARALAVGSGGRLWLASEDGPLLELDRNGRVVSQVGRPDLSPAEALGAGLRRVSSLGLDGRGRLAALDTANHRVVLFAASGEVVGAVGSGLYTRPARLEAFAPSPPSGSRSTVVAPPRWSPAPPNFCVELIPPPESFPAFEPFSLEVRVVSADFDGEGADLQLVVDATMPAHRHGLSARPEVRTLGEGRFRVDGLLLPMAGEWLLHLDVTFRGVTERLEIPVKIE